MNKIFGKILSVILTITMLAGFAFSAEATTADLEIICIADGYNIPAGKSVPVVINGLPGDAASVAVSYGSTDTTVTVADGSATVNLVLEIGTMTATFDVLDSDGNVVDTQTKEFTGCYTEVISKKQNNVDFENGYTTTKAADNVSVTVTKDGSAIAMGLHTGVAENTVTVAQNPANTQYGKSLCLTTNNGSGLNQANNMIAEFTSGTVVYEFDFCTADFNIGRTVISGAYYVAGESSYKWLDGVYLDTDGNFITNSTVIGKAELNTWYHFCVMIDIEENVSYTYMNDALVGVKKLSYDVVRTYKYNFDINKNASYTGDPSSIYIDNINAYNANIGPYGVSISNASASAELYEGMAATVRGYVRGFDADRVEIYKGDVLETTITKFVAGGFSANVIVPAGKVPVVAKAYVGDEIVAVSDTIMLEGLYEYVLTDLWDIDFETETTSINGASIIFHDANGTKLSSTSSAGASTLTANRNNTSNFIGIENRADGAGRAVRLSAADDNEVQFNEFHTLLNDNIVKMEWDYMIESITEPYTSSVVINVMQPVMNSSWPTSLNIYKKGDGYAFALSPSAAAYYPVELRQWNTITAYTYRKEGIIRYYIDGEFLAEATYPTTNTNNRKVVTKLQRAHGTTVWVDNFSVKSINPIEAKASLSYRFNAYRDGLPAGTKISIETDTSFVNGLDSIKMIDTITGEAIATVNTNKKAQFIHTLKEGVRTYKFVAFDASGNVLVQSDEFTLTVNRESILENIWDEDFEGATIASAGGNVKRNGADITSLNGTGQKISTNVASQDGGSCAGIGTLAEGTNGNSLVLTNGTKGSNGSVGTAQMNSASMIVATDYAVVSMDFATSTTKGTDAFAPRLSDNAPTDKYLPSIYADNKGNFTYKGQIVGTYKANTWYNLKNIINTATGQIDVYIDDVYVATYTGNTDITKTGTDGKDVYFYRLSSSNASSESTSLYIDNLRAYRATYIEPSPAVTIINNGYDKRFPAGTLATVTASADFTPAVKELRVVDKFTGLTVLTEDVSDGEVVKLNISVKTYASEYIIASYSADGKKLAENEFVIGGSYEKKLKEVWDEDFENGATVDKIGGTIKRNGQNIVGLDGTSTLTTSGADADNAFISVGAPENMPANSNGNAVILTTLDSDKQAQINQFHINVDSGIAIISYDYATDSLVSKQVGAVISTSWANNSRIFVTTDGHFRMQSQGVNIAECKPNTWYNIKYVVNTATGEIDVFIDNIYRYSTQDDNAKGKLIRLSVTQQGARNTKSYIDNYRVYSVALDTPVHSLADVCYVSDGAAVNTITRDGDLTVYAVVTNDKLQRTSAAYVAHYRDGELIELVPITVPFAEGALQLNGSVKLADVKVGDIVKTMLWDNEDNATPVNTASVLK